MLYSNKLPNTAFRRHVDRSIGLRASSSLPLALLVAKTELQPDPTSDDELCRSRFAVVCLTQDFLFSLFREKGGMKL